MGRGFTGDRAVTNVKPLQVQHWTSLYLKSLGGTIHRSFSLALLPQVSSPFHPSEPSFCLLLSLFPSFPLSQEFSPTSSKFFLYSAKQFGSVCPPPVPQGSIERSVTQNSVRLFPPPPRRNHSTPGLRESVGTHLNNK